MKYAESVAPGQEEEFIAQVLLISSNDQENKKIPDHIQYYLQLYKESDALLKLVILLLLDQSFSKKMISKLSTAQNREYTLQENGEISIKVKVYVFLKKRNM